MNDWNKGLIAWFANNSVAANLLMLVIICGGLFTATTIKKETNPRLETERITVTVPYLGAAPEETEEGVVIKIEEAIQDLEGIKEIRGSANEGSGTVTAEVMRGYEVDEVLDQIKLRVDAIDTFPAETEKPVIQHIEFRNAVLWVQVYGNRPERELKEYSTLVRDELAALPSVTDVAVLGARDYEVSIELSEHRLREYNLTFDEVVNAVRASSLDLPGGRIQTPSGDILLRTTGQAYYGDEFSALVLRTNPDGSRITLGDVATIVDGFEDRQFLSEFNGQPGLAIQVNSVGSQNELEIAEQVHAYVDEKQAELPDGISLVAWGDSAYYLQDRLDLMAKNFLFGLLLVGVVLALFLQLKVAFWVVIGIPVSFLGALWVMPVADVTLHMMSLFAFILVLGIVVDDAIIIGESAYTRIREFGHSTENVVRGAQRVAVAATFGVLTTMAAFVPLLLIDVIVAPLFVSVAVVVIGALGFSLVESKLILPAHLAKMKSVAFPDSPPERGWAKIAWYLQRPMVSARRAVSGALHRFVDGVYRPLLRKAIAARYVTLSGFIGAIIILIGLIQGGYTRFAIFPEISGDFIQVNLQMVDGTASQTTVAALRRMADAMETVDERFSAEEGKPIVHYVLTWTEGPTQGSMVVELAKGDQIDTDISVFSDAWREEVGEIPGARQLTVSAGGHAGGGPPIAFRLVGDDYRQLEEAASKLVERLHEYDGVFDIRNSYAAGAQEVRLDIKPSAEILGLTLQDLGRQVRHGFFGAEAQRVQRGNEDVRVMVRYPKERRVSLGDLEDMWIRAPDGRGVPFSTVADIEVGQGYSSIDRIDRSRSVVVTADYDPERIENREVTDEITKEFLPRLLADYPGVSYGLTGSSLEEQKFITSILQKFLLALFAIYALMAIPLKSYAQPLIIMFVIPFGMVGAVIGHIVMGFNISMFSVFGLVALAGVVVNDSLLMVDFVNKHRAEGMNLREAIEAAGARRFRPILLTSLTTFCGLVPMLLETSLQAQFLIPMAISLAFGIVFATVITLFLIPTLYSILEDIKGLGRRADSGSPDAHASP